MYKGQPLNKLPCKEEVLRILYKYGFFYVVLIN